MKGLGGMGDMARMMKQAQGRLKDMQKQMQEVDATLRVRAVEGSAGGGMVKVIFNGLQEPVDVKIDPAVLEEDPEFLQEMVLAAIRQGLKKSKDLSEEEKKKVMGGLNIPGLEGLL